MILLTLLFVLNLNLIGGVKHQMEGHIVGGDYAALGKFPHSAYLLARCGFSNGCGSSIISQQILLTAAHCIEDCTKNDPNHYIVAKTGSLNKREGLKSLVVNFMMHPKYDGQEILNDIALLKIRRILKYGPLVSRVALVSNFPTGQAFVAGWGYVNSDDTEIGDELKYVSQPIINHEACKRLLQRRIALPNSWICAGNKRNWDYPSIGDSGSALVVQDYIQIGIVSFRNPMLKSLTVYVNVSYYLSWIKEVSAHFYCFK